MSWNLRLRYVAFLCVAASACGRSPATEYPEYAAATERAKAGLVGPLKSDASDEIVSWVDGQVVTDWPAEIQKRERAIEGYLNDADPKHAETYGFRTGQNPRLAWNWFRENPVGFNGVPFVLFKTILDLDPNHPNPALRAIARIWKREAVVPTGSETPAGRWTLDHIGIGPNPSDYVDGVARPAPERRSPLPFGFAFENPRSFEPLSTATTTVYDGRLLARRIFQNTSLLIAKARTVDKEENWERDRPGFGSPGAMDRVFFSCAACHVGRVMASGKMKFLPGMPNTEIEAQYFSKLLMLTGAALVESGFNPASTAPVNPATVKPNTSAVRALYTEMLDKARQRPETLYGLSPAQIARAKIQTLAAADEFPSVIKDLIAVGVKTHFIYYVVAKNNAYKGRLPDVLEDRPGQMDAFGIASGLVAIHTRRADNSFLEFVRRDNPNSPFFSGFSKANGLPADIPGMTAPVTDAKAAGERIFKQVSAWAPAVPAPIDVKSVNWAIDRYHANWDGNQGASSRTLASGASATGDPRMVNVRIHEPLNPFIDHLPPPPYPFASVDLARAREGKGLFKSQCATCHKSRNETIYPISMLGVDPNRTLVNSSVSRFGLAALVMEACQIYGLNHQGQPGADWCMPKGDWQARLDEYFRDTPRRVAEGTNGYKADVLHGVWAQAPYLHNGSVPTLGQLICPTTRPPRFLRGNLYYDEALVGFEWLDRPKARYGPHDTMLIKEYDTTVPSKANTGHTFGADLCPDTSGLNPMTDRKEIEARILKSRAGALLAYLKTM
jgi:RoxA-like, cytochrome c-like